MPLTPADIAQLAVSFPSEHAGQIIGKAVRHGEHPDDIRQEVRLVILEVGFKYDAAIGSFCQFVFGHLEKRLRRRNSADRFAISLDHSDNLEMREFIESIPAPSQDDHEDDIMDRKFPYSTAILSIANFTSGKSTAEIAANLGVTPRRVRQILQKLGDQAVGSTQFGFAFEESN